MVVCEVRAKRTDWGYSPVETIGHAKIANVRRATAAWLASQPSLGTKELRFDAAAVTFDGNGKPVIDYFEDAF